MKDFHMARTSNLSQFFSRENHSSRQLVRLGRVQSRSSHEFAEFATSSSLARRFGPNKASMHANAHRVLRKLRLAMRARSTWSFGGNDRTRQNRFAALGEDYWRPTHRRDHPTDLCALYGRDCGQITCNTAQNSCSLAICSGSRGSNRSETSECRKPSYISSLPRETRIGIAGFQSAPSRGGRWPIARVSQTIVHVSIRALAWRAISKDTQEVVRAKFQSAPSRGGRSQTAVQTTEI